MGVAERFTAWWTKEEQIGDMEMAPLDTFAVRGDGALVCFDEQGYFLLLWTGPGILHTSGQVVENLIQAYDPVTKQLEQIYCEPVWIAGYFDIILEGNAR